MYVGRRHTSTVTLKRVLPFQCPHCAHAAKALVIGIGQGQGNSPYFLDESGAKERASSAGERAAQENAELTLKLAVCPKCGTRDDAAVRALKGKAYFAVVASVVAMVLLGLFVDALKNTHYAMWIFGPGALFCAWAVWTQQSWKWTTIDNRVAFIPKGSSA